MKVSALLITLLLCCQQLGAQKLPVVLENPASPEIALKYYNTYKFFQSTESIIWAGAATTAVGAGLLCYTKYGVKDSSYDDGVENEGKGISIILESLLTASGVVCTLEGVGLNLATRSRLKHLIDKNDFLNTPGENLDTWKDYRALRTYQSSGKWMKASGITAVCLAAGSLAGSAIFQDSDNDFLNGATETSMYLALVSGATFFTSWIVHSASKVTVQPTMASIPATGEYAPGLSFAFTF